MRKKKGKRRKRKSIVKNWRRPIKLIQKLTSRNLGRRQAISPFHSHLMETLSQSKKPKRE